MINSSLMIKEPFIVQNMYVCTLIIINKKSNRADLRTLVVLSEKNSPNSNTMPLSSYFGADSIP